MRHLDLLIVGGESRRKCSGTGSAARYVPVGDFLRAFTSNSTFDSCRLRCANPVNYTEPIVLCRVILLLSAALSVRGLLALSGFACVFIPLSVVCLFFRQASGATNANRRQTVNDQRHHKRALVLSCTSRRKQHSSHAPAGRSHRASQHYTHGGLPQSPLLHQVRRRSAHAERQQQQTPMLCSSFRNSSVMHACAKYNPRISFSSEVKNRRAVTSLTRKGLYFPPLHEDQPTHKTSYR